MDSWLDDLSIDLDRRVSSGLLRQLQTVEPDGPYITVRGRRLLNLASNDYLGLASHPAMKQAAVDSIQRFGVGVGSSRLVSGSLAIHAQAEARFAEFKHAEAALLFPTGYMANLGVLGALAGPGDLICADKLNHASILDSARLCGAELRIYSHLGLEKLERLLNRHFIGHPDNSAPRSSSPSRSPRRLIVTDSVFSMDGDFADLPALCDLADKYDAILVVDEAHGSGVLGETGAGLCELQGVTHRVDAVVSTASKALGGLGGIVTAKNVVIQTMVNHARPFIYTTGSAPWQAACVIAALAIIQREPERRNRLLKLSRDLRGRLVEKGIVAPHWLQVDVPTPIVPIIVGDAKAALSLSEHLATHGFFAPAIRPPTVAPGSSRVRLSLLSDFPPEELDRLVEVIAAHGR